MPDKKPPHVQVRILDLTTVGNVEVCEMGGAAFFTLFARGPLGSSTAVSIQVDDETPEVFEVRCLELNGTVIGIPETRRAERSGFRKVTFTVLNGTAACSLSIVWGDVAVLALR